MERTCLYCYEDFKAGDKLTQLKCTHLFHTDCLIEGLEGGLNTCAICRAPTEIAEPLCNTMMEGGEPDKLIVSDEFQERLDAMERGNLIAQSLL